VANIVEILRDDINVTTLYRWRV